MINNLKADHAVQVTGYTRSEIENDINDAVQMVRNYPMTDGPQGILVTRYNHYLYSVSLSADVPYGLTAERDLWSKGSRQSSSAAGALDATPFFENAVA